MLRRGNSTTGDRIHSVTPTLTRSIAHLIFSLLAFGFGLLASLAVLSLTIPTLFFGWVWHTFMRTIESILETLSLQRRIIHALCALFTTDYTTTLSPCDSFWFHACNQNNQCVIVSFLEFRGPHQPSSKEIKTVFNTKIILPFSRFHSVVTPTKWGMKFIPDPTFDIDDHIEFLTLVVPEDRTEAEVIENFIEGIQSKQMDPSKPLWKAHILQTAHSTTIVTRIHHCIADGMALMSVLLSLTEPVDRGSPRRSVHKETVGWKSRLLTLPISLCHLLGMVLLPKDPVSALKTGQPLGPNKFVGRADTIKLSDLKKICIKYSATVNEIVASVVSSALSKHIDQTEGHTFDIHAMIPFNLRQLTTAPTSELTNKFSLLNLKLPMGRMPDNVRIRKIHNSMTEMKESLLPILTYYVVTLGTYLPGGLFEEMIAFLCNKTSLVFTNAVGPSFPIKLVGAKEKVVSSMGFWAPQVGQVACGISVCSYNGNVVIGLTCDQRTIPDGHRLVRLVNEEFQRML